MSDDSITSSKIEREGADLWSAEERKPDIVREFLSVLRSEVKILPNIHPLKIQLR